MLLMMMMMMMTQSGVWLTRGCRGPNRTTKVTDRHPFNGLFSSTTWVSRHQKG